MDGVEAEIGNETENPTVIMTEIVTIATPHKDMI